MASDRLLNASALEFFGARDSCRGEDFGAVGVVGERKVEGATVVHVGKTLEYRTTHTQCKARAFRAPVKVKQ